jgi:16S rRNA (uracil1498-N3)-methyltransferase
MKRVLCSSLPEPESPRRLLDSEAHHLLRVLRLKEGDRVEALDGSGRSVLARLRLKSGEAWLEFDGGGRKASETRSPVVLELAVLKGDAMEWVIEKAAELGVTEIVPVLSKRTVVQVGKKGPELFQQRWQKIADQALKQCGRLERMEVRTPALLADLLSQKLSPDQPRWFLDEEARETSASLLSQVQKGRTPGAHLLIGPEGGWDDEERALISKTPGVHGASLGPLVLRAETAALFAVSIVTAALRETHPSG